MTDARSPLLQAISLLQRGDAEAALRAASDACHAAPDQPKPHYAYGQAWLAVNQPARAAQAFAAALRLAPEWADAWVNYGIACYRQGDVDAAKTAMRNALRVTPGHAAAIANLGGLMRISGEAQQAEALLREAIVRDPDNAGARLNLVADLLQEERSADALAILDAGTVPVDPSAARHWHLQRALALLQLGRTGQAGMALGAFAALGPCPPELESLWHWRLLLLARAEHDQARAATEAALMARALEAAGPRMVPEHRIMGHYDLAKFFSAAGDQRAAFRHWSAGHALLRSMQPFSRDAHRAFIDANITCLDAARFASGPCASNRDPTPVFIVGMPRSGTTLCEQILAAHAQVHGAGERVALAGAYAALAGPQDPTGVERLAALDTPTLDAAAAAYLTALRALAPEKTRVVDKMPSNYLLLGLIGLLLPGARVIHCTRDPRDIGLSIFTFRFHGHHPYAHDLGDLGWTIAEQERLMAHWKAALPGKVLTLRLSDWVHDFDATLARVLTHLDLPHDPACVRFHERESRVRTVSYAQVRQPVNARGLGRWRAYAEDLAPMIAELEAAGSLALWEAA